MERMVDFEKQSFDGLGANPYEVVIAVSKMARDINDKARKYLPPEQEINPLDHALRRLTPAAGFFYETTGEEPVATEEA